MSLSAIAPSSEIGEGTNLGHYCVVADGVRIQYGGSVKGASASGLFAEPEIDGGLIGGASLKADEFTAIVRAAAETAK